ncbi:c-type cytochrome [Methylobacter psychrophilus]|uniref:c-type cytochrome n=1 Tax=Methylobacter psychrophilus TaxID=96941 RepID=UPI0021D4AA1E|nr:cytochrome c4 [Methylobacter psychrophilus]
MRLSRFVSRLNIVAVAIVSQVDFSQQRRHKQLLHQYWKRSSFLAISTLALITSVKSIAADEPVVISAQQIGSGNPVIGKEKSDSGRCQECHGVDGNSNDERIPNHAGQHPGYLIKQLSNFQSGERYHVVMTIMAEDLNATDKADIAAYFASQKIMHGEGGSDNTSAKNLFVNGDQTRDIEACLSCHGDNGKGKITDKVIYPVIGGQQRVYLRSQLINWKLGDRKNSPGDVMNKIAKSLTDDEIDALANYISGL